MNFEDIKKIFDEHKCKSDNYNFVGHIFIDIRRQYEQEAKSAGKDPNQSWNAWSGKNFQKIIEYAIETHLRESQYPLGLTSDANLTKSVLPADLERVRTNIEVFYDQYSVVPDADIILYDRRNGKVIAVLSCKSSLRERIAQAAYWKVKLQSSMRTKDILCYLVSTDNDEDFQGERKTRNRIIVEHGELDGAYILQDIPESEKVKNFRHIFPDLDAIFAAWFKGTSRE
jgi:type II restriction enzyme